MGNLLPKHVQLLGLVLIDPRFDFGSIETGIRHETHFVLVVGRDVAWAGWHYVDLVVPVAELRV